MPLLPIEASAGVQFGYTSKDEYIGLNSDREVVISDLVNGTINISDQGSRAVLDHGIPAMATIRLAGDPNNNDTFTITVDGEATTFTFKTTPDASVSTEIAISAGNNPAMATALAAAVNAQTGMAAAVPAIDGDDDVVVVWPTSSVTLVAAEGTWGGTSMLYVNRTKTDPAPVVFFQVSFIPSAEEITSGSVLLATGLSSIRSVEALVHTSATNQTLIAWDGKLSSTGGVVVLDNSGSTDIAGTHVVKIWGWGVE